MEDVSELIRAENQESLGFNTNEAWNIDAINPYKMTPEQIGLLFKDVPERNKKTVEGILNSICAEIGWRKQVFDNPIVGKSNFEAVGRNLGIDIFRLANWWPKFEIRPFLQDELYALDILSKQLRLVQVGYDSDMGRREFATSSPGLTIIAFQNDGSGNDIGRLTNIRLIMHSPKDLEKLNEPIYTDVIEPNPQADLAVPYRKIN